LQLQARRPVSRIVLIALGGGAGTVARYWVAGVGQRLTDTSFPLGTLLVNLTGCLLVGLLGSMFTGPAIVREEYRFALMVGFLGGFTTFSTFGYETLGLLSDREWWLASVNVVLSNVVGLFAVWLGHRIWVTWQGG
jgi:CrcB protein